MRYLAGAAMVVALGVGAACAEATKSPQQIIDERVAGMKGLAGNLKGASEAATPADAKAKVAAAIKFAESIPSLFPKGTGVGDTGVMKTRALQEIWKKPAEFKAAADALVAALKAADTAVGDKPKLDAAFGEIRKGCGGCHTPFRGPETD